MVTYIADTSDEEETMALKTGPSLKELMKNRNKAPPLKIRISPNLLQIPLLLHLRFLLTLG